MAEPWVHERVWERASEPDPAADTFDLVACDPDLGSLVVLRAPDGREVIGADSPR